MRRRTFLTTAAGPLLARTAPAGRRGIRLGYDTYSVRAFRWKALEHLDYARRQGLDAIQLSSLDDFESLDAAHLAKVRETAAGHGILIDAGIGCICPTSKSFNAKQGDAAAYMKKGLEVAHAIGARAMRCFMGSANDRQGPGGVERHMESTIKVMRKARPRALDLGVKMALENHGGLQARELKTVIEESGKDAAGACLDTGNPVFTLEDPLLSLEVLAPYVATTHFRDSVLYEHPRGCAAQWVALGDGSIGFGGFLDSFQKLCPGGTVHLEIITGRPPTVFPYLEAKFWESFPKMPAADFARFLTLVKRGRPFDGHMVIAERGGAPLPEYQAALKQQQRYDLERSLRYAREKLGLGPRA